MIFLSLLQPTSFHPLVLAIFSPVEAGKRGEQAGVCGLSCQLGPTQHRGDILVQSTKWDRRSRKGITINKLHVPETGKLLCLRFLVSIHSFRKHRCFQKKQSLILHILIFVLIKPQPWHFISAVCISTLAQETLRNNEVLSWNLTKNWLLFYLVTEKVRGKGENLLSLKLKLFFCISIL